MGRWRAPSTPGSKYITAQGYQRMQTELNRLWKQERPEVTRAVQEAAAQGDRSENAEYIYGKKRLREIDSRVRFLSKRMDNMTVVDRAPEDTGRVFFGAWVALENDAGTEVVYRLVGPDETDMDRRYISVDSPVARALLKKQVDEEVDVRTPQGTVTWIINRIWYDYD